MLFSNSFCAFDVEVLLDVTIPDQRVVQPACTVCAKG